MMLTRDGKILFSTRVTRLFAYGLLSVVLALYLAEIGLSETQIGLLLSLTLAGDVVVSLSLTAVADRIGRRRVLKVGAALMVLAGVAFATTRYLPLLTAAAIIGTISPSGNEVGPFLAIEQAALTQILPGKARTRVFAWYSLAGSLATALGSLCGGALTESLHRVTGRALDGYRAVIVSYALLGTALLLMFGRLTLSTEIGKPPAAPVLREKRGGRFLGLSRSRGFVFKLSGLFMIDAFAGGLIVQSLIAYWFNRKFGADVAVLGSIFFGAHVLAGFSALLAARIAAKIGLINTMVFTHLPSNVLLILVPLMPTLPLAILALLLRFSISQMDVPTRQSYTMAVVAPDERSAASGVTNIARSLGAAISPSLSGLFLTIPFLFGAPFYLAGGMKIVYDVLLYRSFKALKPPEEK